MNACLVLPVYSFNFYKKPLTTYFLKRAQVMYESPIEKEFSPSFWEIENKSPKDWKGFEGVLPGVEHALGKKFYICPSIH